VFVAQNRPELQRPFSPTRFEEMANRIENTMICRTSFSAIA